MDIENLKLIVELVKSISGDASSVVYWWIVLTFVRSFFAITVFAGIAVMVAVLVYRFAREAAASVQELKAIAEAVGVDGFAAWYEPDRRKLRATIAGLQKQ